MKRKTLANLSISMLLIVLTAMSVSAQSQRSKVIEIPFNFIIGDKTLPAGAYTVEPNRRDFDLVWKIRSSDNRNSALFITMAVRKDAPKTTELVFHRYGGKYFLSQIWTPGGNTGRELLMSHLERELAKNSGESRAETVVARRK